MSGPLVPMYVMPCACGLVWYTTKPELHQNAVCLEVSKFERRRAGCGRPLPAPILEGEERKQYPDELREVLELWLAHKRQRRETYKPLGLKALVAKMQDMGPERAAAAVKFSIENNYAGLFEPRGEDRRNVSRQATDQPPSWAAAVMTAAEIEGWPYKQLGEKQLFLENLSIGGELLRRQRRGSDSNFRDATSGAPFKEE